MGNAEDIKLKVDLYGILYSLSMLHFYGIIHGDARFQNVVKHIETEICDSSSANTIVNKKTEVKYLWIDFIQYGRPSEAAFQKDFLTFKS